MQEVASKSAFRLGRLMRDALGAAGSDGKSARAALARARDEAGYLIDRDTRAVRSALSLVEGDAGYDKMRALADRLAEDLQGRLRVEVDRLDEVAGAPKSATAGSPTEADRLVPSRAVDGVPPGVAGLSYDDTAALVSAMHAEDPQVNWETLRIFADELWNLTDGRRTLTEIGRAIGYEFGFRVTAAHFVTLARGLEKAGLFRLETRAA
jgi:hypothetical protein